MISRSHLTRSSLISISVTRQNIFIRHTMNPFKRFSYLTYTKAQRNGLMALFALIAAMQVAILSLEFTPPADDNQERERWMAWQPHFDSLARIKPKGFEQRPFNPNFITDFKGYQWGMSVVEIDRLLAYRKTNRYVNSAAEFQKVTGVSDSLLGKMAPWFKFPEWVTRKKQYAQTSFQKPKRPLIDINQATADDLKAVYGIGDGLSRRILEYKEKLGGFVSMEQMADIWGLSPEVIAELQAHFHISAVPAVRKWAVNDASIKELSQFPYFRYAVAKSIVQHRSMHGRLSSIEDLFKISDFPVEKMKTIALYLEF